MTSGVVYLLFFYIGLNFSLAGISTPFAAQKFSVEPYMVGYAYSMYSVGQTLAALGNGRFLGRVAPRHEAWLGVCLLCIAIVGISFGTSLLVFTIAVFFLGAGAGLFASIGNFAVVSVWEGRDRAVKLNLVNFFFSFGAIVSPAMAGFLLSRGTEWESLYRWVGMLLLLVAAFAHQIPSAARSASVRTATPKHWSVNVYLSAAALFAYVLSEVVVSFWLVSYLQQTAGLGLAEAGFFLSLFWGTIAVGRFCSGFLAGRFAASAMIFTGASVALVSYLGLLVFHSPTALLVLISLMGLGYSCLYATILSFGTLQADPSPRLTTFFVALGCAGGILSYLLSSLLNQLYGLTVTMASGIVLLAAVILLIMAACRPKNRHKKLRGEKT